MAVGHSTGRLDPYGAFVHLPPESAAGGRGLRIGVKDIIDVAGMPTRAGARLTDAAPKRRDAPCVARLRPGHRIVGKTATHEYAFGVTSDSPHSGRVLNPRDPTRIPGGSSGGSAAAVAAGLCDAALGTDTGGSVRVPAALCGVVGYKPRQAAIPRRGVLPLATTFDTVGVLAPDVGTAVAVAAPMLGVDPGHLLPAVPRLGELSLIAAWSWLDEAAEAGDPVEAPVAEAFRRAAEGLPRAALPIRTDLTSAAVTITLVEATHVHRDRYQAHPDAYGADLRLLFDAGLAVPGVDYLAALSARRTARRRLAGLLAGVDALLTPTVPCVAPRFEETGDPGLRPRLTGWTRPFNLADLPAVSVPVPGPGLPAGVQVVAATERGALRAAAALERHLAAG